MPENVFNISFSIIGKCTQKKLVQRVYRGFRIDGPASSWPKGHEKTKSSWPSKNGFGYNSAGVSPILRRIWMVKDTIINKNFRAPGPHRADC